MSVGQNVLCSSQAYVAYLLPEGKLYCIVGHAEIPSVLEFEGGNAEIVPFGAFRSLHTPILFRSRQIFRV